MWVPELGGPLLRFSYEQMHSTPDKRRNRPSLTMLALSNLF